MKSLGFNLNSLVVQGYGGCNTMSGIHNDVYVIVRNEYPKVLIHCSLHRLNLVVNGLNIFKTVLRQSRQFSSFFVEVLKGRKIIENIPLFYETRWSEKYKTIRIFSEHLIGIVQQLEIISIKPVYIHKLKAKHFSCTAQQLKQMLCYVYLLCQHFLLN